MSSPPEPNTQYSRANTPFSRRFRTSTSASGGPGADAASVVRGKRAHSPRGLRTPATTGALVGAALLVAAEFTPLYSLHLVTSQAPVSSTSTAAHDSFALIPVAVLAAALALTAGRPPRATALAAISALGVLTLLISLIGDLPDARAHGLTRGYVLAATTPGPGLYLETLGAVVLLLSGGAGLLSARAAFRHDPTSRLSHPLGRARSES